MSPRTTEQTARASRRPRRIRGAALAALMVGGALVGASGANAFPGDNGALVFSSNRIGPEDVAVPPATEPLADFDIFITAADGSVTIEECPY